MKKQIFALMVVMFAQNATAQMSDALGTLAIDGVITQGGVQALGQANSAMSRLRFQQDLASLITSIQLNYAGNYDGLSKESIHFQGLKGVEWDVGSVSFNRFYIKLQGLDGPSCLLTKGNQWQAVQVDINNGSDCDLAQNTVVMYFN